MTCKEPSESDFRRSLEELVLLASPFTKDTFVTYTAKTWGNGFYMDNAWLSFKAAVHRAESLLNKSLPDDRRKD
jgi:hypothetical protein